MAEPPPAENDKAATIARLSMQLKKLNEANGKYKNLLKMAKERIQQQETELQNATAASTAAAAPAPAPDSEVVIVGVRQLVRDQEKIWALLNYEVQPLEQDAAAALLGTAEPRTYLEWKSFDTESALQDFIRRDTGEPLTIPPYSLSPVQSQRIQNEADEKVAAIQEEFRRFRVRSELARKQTDVQLRELQSSKVKSAAERIEGGGSSAAGSANGSGMVSPEAWQAELQWQEARWKQAYDTLLAENKALKSSGSEALLASQWRQRYETCLAEKEELQEKLKNNESNAYEAKYRDLKESFKLYRKKAKEIFEQQQDGNGTSGMGINSSSSADAKLSYLKNLMVNYFTAEHSMRQPMEGAIGMVLQFTPDEVQRIEKKRTENESWF